MERPGQNDMVAAKHVLRYLRGTIMKTLLTDPGKRTHLNAYGDANWRRDAIFKRKRKTGISVQYKTTPFYFISTVQKTVSLSSTDGEYSPLSDAFTVVDSLQQGIKKLKMS